MPENHRHCRNFASLDVIKGICHRSKELVAADDACCELCERLPRCGHCGHFETEADHATGRCGAGANRPMAYAEMAAVTCESFVWSS